MSYSKKVLKDKKVNINEDLARRKVCIMLRRTMDLDVCGVHIGKLFVNMKINTIL